MNKTIWLTFVFLLVLISFASADYTDFAQVICNQALPCNAWDEPKSHQTLNNSVNVVSGTNPYTVGGWGQKGTAVTTYNTDTGYIIDTDTTWTNNHLNFSIIGSPTDLIMCWNFNDTSANCATGTRWKFAVWNATAGSYGGIYCGNDYDGYAYYSDIAGGPYVGITADSVGIHRACIWFNATDGKARARIDSTTIDTGKTINPWAQGKPMIFDGYSNTLMYGNVSFWNYTLYGLETPPVPVADTTPPSWSNNKTNATSTTPKKNDVVQINITATDDTYIDSITLATNQSGTLTNVSTQTFSGTQTSVTAIFNLTITMNRGLMQWQVWANDSTNNANTSQQFTVVIQNTAPETPTVTYPVDGRNYSDIPYINYSSSDTDGDTITYKIYINNTLNITTTTNVTDWNASDGYYNLTVTANDSSSVSANSTAIHFRLDSKPPYFTNNETNASLMKINGNATFNITINDDGSGLSFYIFSWNGTGVWNNATNGTISGSSTKLVINKTTNLSRGNTINYIWYANDSLNQWNNSGYRSFTVANTIPSIPNLISPSDLSSTSNNYSILKYNSTDRDNLTDTITFYIYGDQTTNPTTLIFNGSGYGNSSYNWSNLNDSSYYWKAKAGDSYENSSNSSVYKFIVSTISPAITLKYPTNNYWFNTRNISYFNFTVQDTDSILSCNLWHNLSGTWQWNQSNTSTITNDGTTHYSFIGANNTIDEGMYIWNTNCSDVNNNYGFYNQNFTFYIDSVQPSISLTQPTGTKTSRTNIQADWTVSEYSIDSCIYNVYRGLNLEVANTSVTCSLNTTTFNVTLDSTFTFNFYANDSAGNTGSNSLSFTVDTTSPAPSGGGGSSSTPPPQCVKTDDCKKFGVKYVCVQSYCIYKPYEDVCLRDGFCDATRGETPNNCGDVLVNKTLVLEGDCFWFSTDTLKMAIVSQYFMWVISIVGVIIVIGLLQTKPKSFTRRTYGRYKTYFRRKRR